MNIALCTDSYLPTMGGTEYVVDILARKLVSDKFGKNRVAVFTQNFCRKNDKDPIFPYEIYRTQSVKVPILGEYVSYPKMDIKFTKDFVDFKPDIVHVHTLNEIGSWAVGLAKSLNVKSILTIHTRYYYAFDIFVPFSEDSFLHKSIVDTFMKKLVDTAENADVLTTVSESSLKDELIDKYKINRKVHVIRNGFDLPEFKFDNNYYSKYNDKDKFLISFAGRINKTKNLEFSLQVINELAKRKIPVEFYIAGVGVEKNNHMKFIEENDIRDNIKWLGRLKQDALFKLHSKCDLFLIPSIFDTDSLAAMEARCCGCPSMVISNTGPAERIVEGENGFKVDYDLKKFVEKIEELYKFKQSNYDEYLKIREKTRSIIPKSWDDIAGEYLELYKANLK